MNVTRDYRSGTITITMAPDEFTETVEWLELASPADGATADWRKWHDEVMPPAAADE